MGDFAGAVLVVGAILGVISAPGFAPKVGDDSGVILANELVFTNVRGGSKIPWKALLHDLQAVFTLVTSAGMENHGLCASSKEFGGCFHPAWW